MDKGTSYQNVGVLFYRFKAMKDQIKISISLSLIGQMILIFKMLWSIPIAERFRFYLQELFKSQGMKQRNLLINQMILRAVTVNLPVFAQDHFAVLN